MKRLLGRPVDKSIAPLGPERSLWMSTTSDDMEKAGDTNVTRGKTMLGLSNAVLSWPLLSSYILSR
jgi:hypothetical protein